MKILRWYGKRDMRLENVEKPTPGRGEVLVRVMRAGVCLSLIHIYAHFRVGNI